MELTLVTDSPIIRLSVSSMCLIEDMGWRIALLLNKVRAGSGIYELAPIGWATECSDVWKKELKHLLEIDDEAFEKGNDLRLRIPRQKVWIFRGWFLENRGREIDPIRELSEELVSEEDILTLEDLVVTRSDRVGYYSEEAITQRAWHEWMQTLRIAEVFRISLNDITLGKLLQSPKIRFVTRNEILERRTTDGVDIWSISKCVVEYRPDL